MKKFKKMLDKMLGETYFRDELTEQESYWFRDFWLWFKMGHPVSMRLASHKLPTICIG